MSQPPFQNGDEAEAAAPLRLGAFLPHQLCQLGDYIRDGLTDASGLSPGLNPAEWRVLMILGEHGTLTARRIAVLGGMHKTKVSRALAALEGRGALERALNLDDLRETFVTLTALGRDHHGALTRASLAYQAELLASLTVAEQSALAASLRSLLARANAIRGRGTSSPVSNEKD